MPSRDQILAPRSTLEPLEVPEWGTIYLKVLSAKDQIRLTEGAADRDIPFRVLVASICDEDGTRLLQDGDEEALKDLPFPLVLSVFGEAARVNGLSSKELEEAMSAFRTARDGSNSSE